MRLVVLYRSHDGENRKSRPAWFSRAGALASLRRSLAEADVEVRFCFVVDRSLPADLAAVVHPSDEVVVINGGRASRSLRATVRLAQAQMSSDPPDTLYWLSEDDYLYRPEAIPSLVAAARELTHVDYFTLYVPDDSEWYATHASQPLYPVSSLPGGPAAIAGVNWDRTRKTTSTFGVRRSALRSDAWLIKLVSKSGSPFDAATMTALQGQRPFPWRHLASDLQGSWSRRGVAKVVAKPLARALVNVATMAARRRRVLIAPSDDLNMHLEADYIPADEGWAKLAAQM